MSQEAFLQVLRDYCPPLTQVQIETLAGVLARYAQEKTCLQVSIAVSVIDGLVPPLNEEQASALLRKVGMKFGEAQIKRSSK